MPFKPGQIANPTGIQGPKPKPYRDALRMEVAALANGEIIQHPRGSLRAIAQARLLQAELKDGHADSKEIADRLDGKVPQPQSGDDDGPPIRAEITWKQSK